MAASREQINGARMMAGNLPVVPSRASLSASGRAAAPSTIRNAGSQRFFGSTHNNVARPASFQQQTASLRQTMQQSHVGAVPAGGRTSAGQSAGFRGSTASGSMQKPSAGTFTGWKGDWQFGEPSAWATNRPRCKTETEACRVRSRRRAATTARRFLELRSERTWAHRTQVHGAWNRSAVQRSPLPQAIVTASVRSRRHREVRRRVANRTVPACAVAAAVGTYWNRTAPSSMQPRGSSPSAGSYGRGSSSSRPQLDMRQPIARGPSYGGSSRSP